MSMSMQGDVAKLSADSDTLYHLPDYHRTGLIAVGTAALISFTSTTALFLFLSYKLVGTGVARCRQVVRKYSATKKSTSHVRDECFPLPRPAAQPLEAGPDPSTLAPRIPAENSRNPYPILVYNLLLAEMHTSLGYTLNIEWVVRDGIYVGTAACWSQGWLNNIGILASSIFLISISLTTYLSVVRGWRPPQWLTHGWTVLCWVLALALTSAGIISTNNGRDEGGWYVRANTWCWVNAAYASARLWGEWAWILASIPITIILYAIIFWSLYSENRSSRHLPLRHTAIYGVSLPSGHHPAFLLYPFIYILCTSPLAIARLITISGGSPSTTYYCIAGLTLATNGFWNTILWLTTMMMSTPEDMRNTGLDQFTFMRTPASRKYGNMVWINGPVSKRTQGASSAGAGWWWWRMGGQTGGKGDHSRNRNSSQESLRRETVPDNCIHLDVITTVVVEDTADTATETSRSANSNALDKIDERLSGATIGML